MRTVLLGVLIAAASVNEASATPAWCNVEGKQNIERAHNSVTSATGDDMGRALFHIVRSSCAPDDDSKRAAAQIEAARQRWSKRLHMTEADWADAADWAATPGTRDFGSDFIGIYLGKSDQRFAFSALSPIQQFIAVTQGVPNSINATSYADSMYFVDALGPRLSETGRFAHVLKCITSDNAVELAICDGDVKRLDRNKVITEVRAENQPGALKMKIRMQLAELDGKLAKYEERVQKWRAKDRAYAQMFDIAAKTRGDWDQLWTTHQPLVELMLAMDDARETRSKQALDGCADRTRAAWHEAVSRIPASKFVGFPLDMAHSWIAEALTVILATPQGYLAGAALYSCHKGEHRKDHMLNALGDVLESGPGLRGPRLASHWAIAAAALSLDEVGAKIEFPGVGHSRRFEGGWQPAFFGTVAKIGKPDADGRVEIQFATKLEKQEQCLESRPSKQVSRVRDDGSLEYNRDCLKWGVVAIDRTPQDQVVKAEYLAGLKPGMSAYAGGGAVMAVFPKGKKTPSAVAGVAVK